MTHWYGWLGLGFFAGSAMVDGARLVRAAWRDPPTGAYSRENWGPLWVAAWVTLAVAMVLA